MWRIIIFAAFTPFTVLAKSGYNENQRNNGKGIKFEEHLSWNEIREKAKAESKYIFVDAYATWCGPCKAMDKNVYKNEKVGDYFNDRFLSVKVQMDRTITDSEAIKKWYDDAEDLKKEYNITSLPTFSFFFPNGRLAYRSSGYRDTTAFIELGRFASDPEQMKFYDQLEAYRQGEKNYASLPSLIKCTKELLGDQELAKSISRDYKKNYLDKLSIEELNSPKHLQFARENSDLITSSKDKFFFLYYSRPARVDSILNTNGYSQRFVNRIIAKEQIWDIFFKDGECRQPTTKKPKWKGIYALMTNKYNEEHAGAVISETKPLYYRMVKDWRKFASAFEEQMGNNSLKSEEGLRSWAWELNVTAWDVFFNCNNRSVLRKALRWIELAIKLEEPMSNVQYLGTRAILLYKLGRVHEAIAQEEAIKIGNANSQKRERRKRRICK